MLRKKSALLLSLLTLPVLAGAASHMMEENQPVGVSFPPIGITSAFPPSDISGGAANASLSTAAVFAWQEFIALNWPAISPSRDFPQLSGHFGDNAVNGPVVWETMRGKVEIFPGTGVPHGYSPTAPQFGYQDPPRYVYKAGDGGVGGPYTGLAPGEVPACSGQPAVEQPALVNLDETTQIGLDTMYAGAAPSAGIPGQQILFTAKANTAEYSYVVPKSWYDGVYTAKGLMGTIVPAKNATLSYLEQNHESPPAGADQLISFLNNTIEVKAAWRLLTPQELASGRFATATARYYEAQTPGQVYNGQPGQPRFPCWREKPFGLLSLHIIQKTPTAPYFTFATFGQADNLLDAHGNPVEDDNGNLIPGRTQPTALTPDVVSKNATAANPANQSSIQHLTPPQANCQPGPQLSYRNTANPLTPQGTICVNQRKNPIPADVIAVNQAAHQAISIALHGRDNPWLHYKLVNVQYKPIDKPTPGADYTGPDAATYYQANIVVETDYNLQKFSGQFQKTLQPPNQFVPTDKLITDFSNNGTPLHNTYAGTKQYNMGGCMGCHGNAQVKLGTDFSFILAGQRVASPDPAGVASGQKDAAARYGALLQPSH